MLKEILIKVADICFNAFENYMDSAIEEHIVKKSLEVSDEKLRIYLETEVSARDYEEITPKLRTVLRAAYISLFNKLDSEHAILYNQSERNTERLFKQNEQLDEKMSSIGKGLSDTQKAMEDLKISHNDEGTDDKNAIHIITKERPVSPSDKFMGRVEKIKDIEKILQNKTKIVLLSGMGGIGKTEICREIFEKYTLNPETSMVKNLGWIFYHDSLKDSFYKQFKNIEHDDIEKYWAMAKEYINRMGTDLLLIIDNANTVNQIEAAALSGLGCRLLLTSRIKIDRIEPIFIDQLLMEDCICLYRSHSGDMVSADDIIRKIVELAARHTLSVELLAKTQLTSGKTAEEMIEILISKGFALSDIEEEITYIHNPEINSDEMDNGHFIKHILKIFDLSEIKKKETELQIVQLFSLLEPNTPIQIKTIKKWFGLDNLKDLNSVIDKGWIIRDNKANGAAVYMHPIITTAIRNSNKPEEYIKIEKFIKNISNDLKLTEKDIFTSKLDTLVHVSSIIKIINFRTADFAFLLSNAAFICGMNGEYKRAMEWYGKALEIREKVLGRDHPSTAGTYNNMAWVYSDQGEYEKALEWYGKALEIREKVLGRDHPDTAVTYNNIANIYHKQQK